MWDSPLAPTSNSTPDVSALLNLLLVAMSPLGHAAGTTRVAVLHDGPHWTNEPTTQVYEEEFQVVVGADFQSQHPTGNTA